jgi:hypothetical protein
MAGLGFTASGHYRLLQVVDGKGSRLALDDEVHLITTPAGEATFALTEAAVRAGDRQLVWQDGSYNHAALHAFLGRWIYRDQAVLDLVRAAGWGGLGVLVAGLVIAIPADVARARERRHGRRLKGPELVTAAQFNRRHHADGIGFVQERRVLRRTACVRVPRWIEARHFLMIGDSGTGKTSVIRQLLQQVEDRGEIAIVYDPAREYTAEFYTPTRGDLILNPLDARSPAWRLEEEWQHEAETLTLATSLFPDGDRTHDFFVEAPRKIFAHLLTRHPSPEQLCWWLCHPDEIDRCLAGTEHAVLIDRAAPDQRSGVLASLNMVADALKLLPAERDTTECWSASTWAAAPRGWLFLTSTANTRACLAPLISLWLDTLILRLMSEGSSQRRPTWFVLDELASLQRLPQLHTAMTEGRKSHNPVVLGFQGRSQLESRYGRDAEAILSQPATKIFLGTSEPYAAKWIAECLGEIEIERLRESRSSGWGGHQTYGLERQVEPLVLASEITGLAPLHGFMKVGNLVVRLSLPFFELTERHPAFVERARPLRDHDDASRIGSPVTDRPASPVEPTREPPRKKRGAGHDIH